MRQFEIRELKTNALIVIVQAETIHEAWAQEDFWTAELGIQIIVKEITK